MDHQFKAISAPAIEDCLAGDGEMGALMRSFDWSKTPLGPVSVWPQSLRTAVSICLNSRFPILIWWGPELVMLYNDAYRLILGPTKHPQALGQAVRECWPEMWHRIGPILTGVLERGESTWSNDQLLLPDRDSYLEECHFTFSYSPIRNESGGVNGVFCTVTETTGRVIGELNLITNDVTRNEGAQKFFSYVPKHIGSDALWEMERLHPEDRDRVMRYIHVAIESGQEFWQDEYRLLRTDGTHADVQARGKIIRDDGGRAIRLIGSIKDVTEQKRLEKALRRSEERLRLATQTGKVGLWDWDIVANRVSWTDSLYIIHGVKPEECNATVEGFATLVHPDDLKFVSVAIQRALANEAPYELEFRAVRPDGEIIWLFTNAQVIRDGQQPIRMFGVTMDITERKRAEIALRESEQRFTRFMQHLPGLAWIKDLEGRYMFANDAAERMWQKTKAELYGRQDEQIFSPEDAAHFRDTDQQALVSGSGVETIETTKFKDGLHNSIVRKFPIPGSDETPSLIGGIAIDITERIKAEEALRNSEKMYRAIGESIDYGVWVCDPDGRNIYASESFLRLVGLTQEQCSNFGWGEVLHPDDAERTIAAWKECVRTGGHWDIEHRFRGIDGKWHPILARGVPVKNDRGEITAWVGINLDISRLKQVENELREADRRKDEFLATLAHELRNPLAPIRNGLQIMRLMPDKAEAVEQARLMMERQLQQMVHLIDDLLDLSRISRGKIELRKERAALAAVVQSAIETSRPMIEQSGHQLTVSFPPDSTFVDADVTRLAQVFSNLLNNAAKYTEKGGHIWLSVERQGSEVAVSVKDNGIGIPSHMLSQVFEMFTQVDRSPGKSQEGLGIGLSITKRLVEMHNGTVEARSDGHGLGSEFIVRLPVLLSTAHEAQPSREDKQQAGTLAPRRILVVDDNEDSASSMALMIEFMGHEVRTAYTGLEAIEVASAFQPHVILLDIGMPGLNGYDACRRIREQSWAQDVVIIALTGWGQDEDKRRSQEAGFNHHLVKPVEPEKIEKLLAVSLGSDKSHRDF